MNVPNKDEQVIQHIVRYCNQIDTTIKTYKIAKKEFDNNFAIQNALSMPLLQIGELVKKLSMDFREKNTDIPWKAIAGMIDRFAHNYDGMDKDIIWNTAFKEMPELNKYCKKLLKESNIDIPKIEKLNSLGFIR